MSNNPRYLITTADERSWVFDRPVLFLGKWCCRYDRKHIWSKMDAIVAEPYVLKDEQKERIEELIELIKNKIMTDITSLLNDFHQVKHTERYWKIVIGHWLRIYVSVMYNRYSVIKQVIEYYNISGTAIFELGNYSFASTTSTKFQWRCNDDLWNHCIYSRLLQEEQKISLDYIQLDLKRERESYQLKTTKKETSKRGLTRTLLMKLGPLLKRETDAFILNTYLPAREALKLQLSFYQFPQLWDKQNFKEIAMNSSLRGRWGLEHNENYGVERYIRQNIVDFIPSCYLEGYSEVKKTTMSLNWPSKPKFVFTSNNFDSDEVFKVWVASKVEQGIPYFAGQHGNNYETRFNSQICPEVPTCDKFITWGWSTSDKKCEPAFIFKIAGKQGNFDPLGGLLLIEVSQPHRLGPFDNYYEFSFYHNEQFVFSNGLPKHIHEKLIVRLHHQHYKFSWDELLQWDAYAPGTTLEMGKCPLDELISKSRLVVHSYDSTGLLEGLALNIPTLCFWSNEFEHVLLNAKPYYELLKAVGIYQSSAEDAVKFIAENWSNLAEWWFSKETQKARAIFCNRFAQTSEKPIRLLKQLLTVQDD